MTQNHRSCFTDLPGQSLCARCSAIKGSCCQQDREIFLTLGDIRRIGFFTSKDDFHEMRAPRNPEYLPDPGDPVWASAFFGTDLRRRVVKTSPKGECCFFTPAGCMLPCMVRPLVCRIFPYEYDFRDLRGLSGDCPRELVRPGRTLIEELSMEDLEQVRRWHRMLYEEIIENVPVGRDGGTSASATAA